MSWTYSDDYYREYTRTTWNESAPHYGPVQRNLDQWTPALLLNVQPRTGMRVLDIATGPGEPALTIAPLVAPGEVLGIDLSERMIEVARSRAKERKLDNARFEIMDAEKLDLPDASFDAVTCRFGLQIVTDPDRAIAEVHRVLKPGGAFAASVWGPAEKSPAIDVIIGPMLEHAEPDETGYLPTPYEMGGPNELVDILRAAGFAEARERRVTFDWTFRDEAEFFRATLEGTPIGHSLREEDEDVQKRVLARTRENLVKFRQRDGSFRMPNEACVVHARK